MAKQRQLGEFLTTLGRWEGFEVAEVQTEDDPTPDVLGEPSGRIIIQLRPRHDAVRLPVSRQ